MTGTKILVVRKMSALEYYYNGKHPDKELHDGKEMHDSNMDLIKGVLDSNSCEYKIVTRKELSEQLVDKYDAVISAGGDGTVIATATHNKDKPQLNLVTDERSKGVLCQKNLEQSIRALLNGNYNIECWTRQEVYLDHKYIGRALNETCIGEDMDFSKMAKYNINFWLNRNVSHDYHENSGLIIATGTGSTGWPSLFRPMPRNGKSFVFSTVISAVGNFKSGFGDIFEITYSGHNGKVAIDTVKHNLPRNSILEVKISDYPLKVVIPDYQNEQ